MVFLLATALVAVDQLSKAWISRTLPLDGREIPLALGFRLVNTHNNGAAFGIFRNLDLPIGPVTLDGTLLLGLLSLVVSIVLVVYLARNGRRLPALPRVALALVLAGAVGNMIDRFRLRYVVDFVHFRVGAFDFAVFNVADASVVVGAGLLVLASLLSGGGHDTPAEASPTLHEPRARQPESDFPDVPPLRRERDEGAPGRLP